MERNILDATAPVNRFRVEYPLMRDFRRNQHHLSFLKRFADATQGTEATAANDLIQFVFVLAMAADLLVWRYSDMVEGIHIANIR